LADRFEYRSEKERVQIYWNDRPVVVLRKGKAASFLRKMEGLSDSAAQLLMARVTGNFKRGNERVGKNQPKNQGNES